MSWSEVDVTDPDDVKVMVADPKGAVLVHLGSSNYLERYPDLCEPRAGVAGAVRHVDSVSLRYDGQIIMNPDAAAARAKQNIPTGDTGTVATPPVSPTLAVHAKKSKKH